MGNKVRTPLFKKKQNGNLRTDRSPDLSVPKSGRKVRVRFCPLLEEHPRLTKESVQSRTGSESDAFQELQ